MDALKEMQAGTPLRRIAAVLALWACAATAPALGSESHGEILWDNYGIPHVYATDIPSVIRGYGYAQMEAHAETILSNLARARGRAAEYFGAGSGDAYVQSDIQVRTFGIPGRARRWLAEGGELQRSYLEAAAAGMNEYAAVHGDTIAPAFLQLLPIAPEDILADFQLTVTFTFQSEQSGVPQLVSAWQSGSASALRATADKLAFTASPMAGLPAVAQGAKAGSNGWALAPSRSADGNAMLVGNPHLPWGNNQPIQGLGLYQWFEANLVVGNPKHPRLNAEGVSFPGAPFLGIAYSDDIGWTHTNDTIKNADLYELTLTGPDSYLWEGGSRAFHHRNDSIKILQSDGSYATEAIDIVSSVHGPVITPPRGNKVLALRVAGLNAPSPISQYWGMITAHDLRQFIEANSALQMPFFNVIYADRGGHIMYLFGGLQPVRSGGTFYDWAGILPGDQASALWSRTLEWEQLPKALDPPGGFVQNGNDAPWTATFPQVIRYSEFPAWIAPLEMDLRPQHGANFLLSQPTFTAADLLAGKMSTRMALADRLAPDLIRAALASGDPTAVAAANVLAAWDHNADEASRGALLFEAWYDTYSTNAAVPKDASLPLYFTYPAFRVPYNPADPLRTPEGLQETTIAVQALIGVATEFQSVYGALDVPWGSVHRTVLVTHDPTLQSVIPLSDDPESGPDDVFGAVRTVWPFPAPDGHSIWHYGGDGYVQLVEFTPQGARAQALLTYGNSSRPGSPHITDQLPLFGAKQLRPVLRTREEVEAAAVARETY
ncbi:MAG TPA: penicillin acylase family protein [Burkholderiaceae bacterium]|nr:penicillin acylase family protein [Burkholderiaceae bacterium]